MRSIHRAAHWCEAPVRSFVRHCRPLYSDLENTGSGALRQPQDTVETVEKLLNSDSGGSQTVYGGAATVHTVYTVYCVQAQTVRQSAGRPQAARRRSSSGGGRSSEQQFQSVVAKPQPTDSRDDCQSI